MSPKTMPRAASSRAAAPERWGGCSPASSAGSDAAGGPVTCGAGLVSGGPSGRVAVEPDAVSPLGDAPAACSVVIRHPPRIGPCPVRSVPPRLAWPHSEGVRAPADEDTVTEEGLLH